jgi:hypothetical protein
LIRRTKKKPRRNKVQKRAIKNERLLDEFRTPGNCELCNFWFLKREPHHVIGKGTGGWRRLDIRINLIAVGSSQYFTCDCHRLAQANRITLREVREVVAKREGVTVEQIEETVNRLLWGPQADNLDYRGSP